MQRVNTKGASCVNNVMCDMCVNVCRYMCETNVCKDLACKEGGDYMIYVTLQKREEAKCKGKGKGKVSN
jgi:hypothetical protein